MPALLQNHKEVILQRTMHSLRRQAVTFAGSMMPASIKFSILSSMALYPCSQGCPNSFSTITSPSTPALLAISLAGACTATHQPQLLFCSAAWVSSAKQKDTKGRQGPQLCCKKTPVLILHKHCICNSHQIMSLCTGLHSTLPAGPGQLKKSARAEKARMTHRQGLEDNLCS